MWRCLEGYPPMSQKRDPSTSSGQAAGTHFLGGAGKQQIPFGNDRKKSKGKNNGGYGLLFADVGDVPDGAAAVVGYVEAAVVGYGYSHGAAPDLAVSGDEAGEEGVVLAGGVA